MKKRVAIVSTLVGLVVVGSAYAGSFTHKGVLCTTKSAGVLCVPETGKGYGIGISNQAVIVTLNNKMVFAKVQPRSARW